MRYLIPAQLLASPALAHTGSMAHTHAAQWLVPFAVALIVMAAGLARRRAVRSKT